MQYCIINNDIALLMHYRALLQMPDLGSLYIPSIHSPNNLLTFMKKS